MINKDKTEHVVVLVTAPGGTQAGELARALVAEGLAACVNLVPGLRSIYRDQGKLTEATEVLLLIKTRTEVYPRLEARVRALHPYRVPEVIAVPVTAGSASYLEWLDRAVSPPAT